MLPLMDTVVSPEHSSANTQVPAIWQSSAVVQSSPLFGELLLHWWAVTAQTPVVVELQFGLLLHDLPNVLPVFVQVFTFTVHPPAVSLQSAAPLHCSSMFTPAVQIEYAGAMLMWIVSPWCTSHQCGVSKSSNPLPAGLQLPLVPPRLTVSVPFPVGSPQAGGASASVAAARRTATSRVQFTIAFTLLLPSRCLLGVEPLDSVPTRRFESSLHATCDQPRTVPSPVSRRP